jgi:hypothetical protein
MTDQTGFPVKPDWCSIGANRARRSTLVCALKWVSVLWKGTGQHFWQEVRHLRAIYAQRPAFLDVGILKQRDCFSGSFLLKLAQSQRQLSQDYLRNS